MGFKLRHHWAVSQAAWRASISPTLNGLMVGAFCLVIFGAIAFGLAIPPYIQAETAAPSATQTLMKYVSFGVGADSATQANGEEGASGAGDTAGDGGTQTVLGQAPVLASLNSFVAQSPQVVQAKQQASSQGGTGQTAPSQGNTSNGGS